MKKKIVQVEKDIKTNIFENFSFTNVDNLTKNMHLFNEKLNQKKEKIELEEKKQMFSSITKGSLDMLFSSSVTTQKKKVEIPKDLQVYVDKLSKRFNEIQDIKSC